MKTTYILAGAVLSILLLTYCKSKQTVVAATPAATLAPVASDANLTTQLQVANKRWPGTIEAELDEGKTIYSTKCTQCHKAYTIEGFGERKWLHEIDDMSPKAKLTDTEKQKLTKYILSYRELKSQVKQN